MDNWTTSTFERDPIHTIAKLFFSNSAILLLECSSWSLGHVPSMQLFFDEHTWGLLQKGASWKFGQFSVLLFH